MRTIHIQDHGQDFLRWTVNEEGIVVRCEPFQGWLWEGCRVLTPKALKRGDWIDFISKDGIAVKTLNYRVDRIEVHAQ